MKEKIKTYLLIMPRWFALPAALTAIALGGLLANGMTWQVWVAMLAGTIIMVGGHAYNSWADYFYGLDRGTPASVGKWYTRGSQVISGRMTTLNKTLAYWVVCYAISAGLVAWIAISIGSAWPWLAWGIAVTTGTIYSPGFCKGVKHLGFPEYCGIGGFGIGGCLMGYAASCGSVGFEPILAGLSIGLFFAVGWVADQAPDAESDYQKGVRNLGTIIAVTKFPMALYFLPVVVFTYIIQLFVIVIGVLSPWTFLSALALPLIILACVWLQTGQDDLAGPVFEKGVKLGLTGLFFAMALMVVGQAVGS